MELIDLHCHTTASDGIYTPSEMIDYAIANNVRVLAITDHDTIDGLEEALSHAQQRSFACIPGIEFSIEYTNGSFHLLGLGIDYTHPDLLSELAQLQKLRKDRIFKIIKDLQNHGISITDEEIEHEAVGNSPGRPHVARLLVKKGYAGTIAHVFENFMVKGKPGYIKKDKISFYSALKLIKASGGIPVIAHPISLGFSSWEECENILKKFFDAGVQGIEVFSGMHTDEDVSKFLQIAQKYSVIITGGSDFHGDKQEKIGFYGENKPIPLQTAKQFIQMVR